jgi:HSP20 family protein
MSTLITSRDDLYSDNGSLRASGLLPALNPAIITLASHGWSPPVDITETEQAYRIIMDLAGLRAEDAVVQISHRVITVHGQRRRPVGDAPEKSHRSERPYGSFARSFLLPPNSNDQRISLNYQAGVLSVSIDKLPPGRQFKVTGQEVYEISA